MKTRRHVKKLAQTAGSFAEHVRRQRLERNSSVAGLAKELGVTRSYLWLVEAGERRPSENLARKMALALGDDPDWYAEWVQSDALRADALEKRARFDVLNRQGRPPIEVKHPLNVDVRLAAATAVTYERGGRRPPKEEQAVTGPPGTPQLRVPIVDEGTLPAPSVERTATEWIALDQTVLPDAEPLERSFAWRLTDDGARYALDILQTGDVIVIGRTEGPPISTELYAIRKPEGRVLLGRVEIRGDVLLVLNPDGTTAEAFHARGASPLSLVVGRVAVVIRPWHYTVITPRPDR